ncbi:MAG: flagellar biosynthetic protein FliR [Bdellovibrionales bacterium]|nr:flagellar biosynthetic protein FliR [Bdellovibrionales bacterium]
MEPLLLIPVKILESLDLVLTFSLLVVRYTSFMWLMPGLATGNTGKALRMPAGLAMAYASVLTSPVATVPDNIIMLGLMFGSEAVFGMVLGFIPAMIFSGVQVAGQLSSTTMGLGAAQLLDPTLGVSTSSIGRLMSDLSIVVFLFLGGHYILIYAVAGLGGTIVPGSFVITETTASMLINSTARIFEIGVMISAPVIVALLLTQFVMGLITKAVPSVNIFIVSFPLTIGIGLILTGLSFPEIVVYLERHWQSIEGSLITFTQSVQQVTIP